MNLIRRLNMLGKEINTSYPRINSGGCCVYASLVAEELIKLGVKVQGIVGYWNAKSEPSLDYIRPLIKTGTLSDWHDNGVNFSHVGLEFIHNGYTRHYDSNGVSFQRKKLMGFPLYDGRLLPKELRKLAASREGWNPYFNRRDIPDIRKLIAEHMSKVKIAS